MSPRRMGAGFAVRAVVAAALVVAPLPRPASGLPLPVCPDAPVNIKIWSWDSRVRLPETCTIVALVQSTYIGCMVTATTADFGITSKTVWADLIIKKQNGDELLRCEAPKQSRYSEAHNYASVIVAAGTPLICEVPKANPARQPRGTIGAFEVGTMACAVL